MNVDESSIAIDVPDLEADPLGQTKPQRVDRPETDTLALGACRFDDPSNLLEREDCGELGLGSDAEHLQRLPITRDGVREEELHAGVGDLERTGRETLLVLQIREIIPHLRFTETIGRLREVLGELAHRARVSLAGASTEPGKLQVLKHPST